MDDPENLEESLVVPEEEEESESLSLTWDLFILEAKRLGYLAGPMVAMNLAQYSAPVISMMMVGHLGELALSSTALAVSITNVTGYSLMAGMAGALETLCGQAYGAQRYRKVGNQTYGAIFCLLVASLFVSILWFNMEKLLTLIGQDPIIAHEAGRFSRWLIPALFSHAIIQPLVRYYQTQSLIAPMIISSCVTLSLHVPVCWALVYKTELKNVGGALAISISNGLNVIFLVSYMIFSSACEKTCVPISMEIFHGIGRFFRLAIPSAIMSCLQWWSYELIILLSGLLPNPQLETSVLSICLTTLGTLYSIPYGLGAAVSTRISNELGGGRPEAARIVFICVTILAVSTFITVSGILYASRHVFGYIFSSDDEVVGYVSAMAPLLCLSVIIDGCQGVLSGVARGCGWQHIGAYINIAALYLCGVPVACMLGFWLQFNGRGLWIGVQIGAFLQAILLSLVTSYTNWKKEADTARERIFASLYAIETFLSSTYEPAE